MKFLTFLNTGCLDICKNMLLSAERVGMNMEDFYIACLDNNAYENLKKYSNAFMWINAGYVNEQISEYQNWTFNQDSGFRNVVKYKWRIIEEVYRQYKQLCWVDTDIVFKQNPIEMISGHDEILFQSDRPGSTLCSGFMILNSSQECEELVRECSLNTEQDDQLLVNEIALNKYYDNIALLEKTFFQMVKYYLRKNEKKKQYMFNII